MTDYYLIRFHDSTILGPMSAPRILSHLLNGDISLEAEITGDLGPWITLSEVTNMEHHYPKIKTLIEQHHLYRNLPTKGLLHKLKGFLKTS